jgi:two-component system sensor histidine kinase CpxA
MRLFWKLFFVLGLTLILTAALSTWVGRQWIQENQEIEARLATLSDQAETASSLFTEEGRHAYQQWLKHARRSLHFRGLLLDSQGRDVLGRPVPEHLRPLVKRVLAKQERITLVQPPTLAVALPVDGKPGRLYWIAASMIPRTIMRQSGKYLTAIRLLSALAVILLISWVLTRTLTSPIRSLQAAAMRLGEGALETRTPSDLSRRKDELGDLARSFDNMALQLDSMVKSHKQLLRDVSHELRSPLARLQIALELARNRSGDRARNELDRIEKEAERLNRLIEEVLTLTRLEQASIQMNRTRLQLDKILKEVVEDSAFEAQSADKRIVIESIEPCVCTGDPLWLRQAFDNVIRNAIRHTDAETEVSVSLSTSDRIATVVIRDHGPGVPGECLPHLFEPFYKVSSARGHHGGGFGLGLAIARHAISLHGGDITAINPPEGGLEIRITLDISASES